MDDITVLLSKAAKGDKASENGLYEAIYAELHRLASRQMGRERRDHSLQPTALVNEAYMKLFGNKGLSWESRGHFYNAAAQTMRRILIDHARTHKAQKRDGIKVELAPNDAFVAGDPDQMLAIDEVLTRLRELDERAARVVELRFFAGLSVEEAAEAMGISAKTVKRDWEFARVWLEKQLRGAKGAGA